MVLDVLAFMALAIAGAAFALRARSFALRGAFAARVFRCFSRRLLSLSLRRPIGPSFL